MLAFVFGLLILGVNSLHSPEGTAYLDSDERYHLYWTYTDTEITFTITAKTLGWVGLGFSPNGGMEGADIITAWVKDGKTYIQDRHATRKGLPRQDNSQDVELIEGKEMNGETIIKFKRKINTCDKTEDLPILTDTMRLIWAISADGRDPAGDDPSYHSSNRGTRSLYLLTQSAGDEKLPKFSFTFDIRNNDIEIPAKDTMYWCEVKRPPKLSQKHHIIKVEPIIEKENLGFVHHMIVYACFDKLDREHFFDNKNTGHNCYNANMPRDLQTCRTPIIVWAIGGEVNYYPEEAGYPLGDAQTPSYFMIETHYDNPQLVAGKRDSSGMRITLTPILRKYDAGIIQAGMINGIAVPPRQKDFIVNSFCSANCTKKIFKEDVNIFGVYLHAHLAGRKVITRHFRGDTELGVLSADHHYDFNYQQGRLLKKHVTFKPGDGLMVTCHYSTEDRKNRVTYGGLPSSEEMCLAFVLYYPRQDVGACMTVPSYVYSFEKYAATFGVKLPPNFQWWQWQTIFNNATWTEEQIRKHETYGYNIFPQFENCGNMANENVMEYAQAYKFPIGSRTPAKEESTDSVCDKNVIG